MNLQSFSVVYYKIYIYGLIPQWQMLIMEMYFPIVLKFSRSGTRLWLNFWFRNRGEVLEYALW